MAQESIDDFIQMSKDYAKAEKELGVQRWVFISIKRDDENGNRIRIFSYDLPREVYERRRWVIEWRKAKFVCQYPKGHVQCCFSFYDKRLGNNFKLTEDLGKLISAKAQVTKVQRKIDEYVAYNKSQNMFFDENSDENLLKTRKKLAIKIADVKAAEERLKQKLRQIKEEKHETE